MQRPSKARAHFSHLAYQLTISLGSKVSTAVCRNLTKIAEIMLEKPQHYSMPTPYSRKHAIYLLRASLTCRLASCASESDLPGLLKGLSPPILLSPLILSPSNPEIPSSSPILKEGVRASSAQCCPPESELEHEWERLEVSCGYSQT